MFSLSFSESAAAKCVGVFMGKKTETHKKARSSCDVAGRVLNSNPEVIDALLLFPFSNTFLRSFVIFGELPTYF